jgi:hypothetical protein
MDYPIISFTSNNPRIICMGTELHSKIDNKNQNIHIIVKHPWIKLINIIIVDARFNKTCWSIVFLTMANNNSSIRENWEGN